MKEYAPEIAEYMEGYHREKHAVSLKPKQTPQRILIYDVECLYEHQIKPHTVTHSRVELTHCPHCGSSKIRTTLRFYEHQRRNGHKQVRKPKPEAPAETTAPLKVEYSDQEQKILNLLKASPIVTRDELRRRVWGGAVTLPAIHAAISRVRNKMPTGDVIYDRDESGYRLVDG